MGNGHFWEWWDGNIFVKWFQLFLVVLDHQAITIKSFSATSPLLAMVYRWFLCLSNIGFYRLGHCHRPSHRRTNALVSMDRSHLYLCVKEMYNFNSHEKIVISGLKRALTSLCAPLTMPTLKRAGKNRPKVAFLLMRTTFKFGNLHN